MKSHRKILAQRAGLCGDPLGEAQTALLTAESVFLRRFAGVYRGRDAAAAARFDDDLFAALQPYHELDLISQPEEVGDVDEAEPDTVESSSAESDDAELKALRKENLRLTDQLRVGMEAMSRVVNEYSTMFEPEGQAADPPAAAEPTGAQADAETAEEAAPDAVAQTAAPADPPETDADDAIKIVAEETSESASDLDSMPATEAEPEHPIADATADADAPTPIEPPAEAPIAAVAEEDSDDPVSHDPAPPAEAATGDEVAATTPESGMGQAASENDQDEIEVQGGMPEGAEAAEPAADEATDHPDEQVAGKTAEESDDVETSVEAALDAAELDSTLPKAQAGS